MGSIIYINAFGCRAGVNHADRYCFSVVLYFVYTTLHAVYKLDFHSGTYRFQAGGVESFDNFSRAGCAGCIT
jgi:hypothetical protein